MKVYKWDLCLQPLTKMLDFSIKLAQKLLLYFLHEDISFLGDITAGRISRTVDTFSKRWISFTSRKQADESKTWIIMRKRSCRTDSTSGDSLGTFQPIWIWCPALNKKLLLFNIFKGRRGFKKLYYCFHRQTAGHITATKAWADGAADKGRPFKIDTH